MGLIISVVVPVFNGGAAFRSCLHSLAMTDPAPSEIIVVDDGSTDDSANVAREFSQVRLFSTGGRKGPATARNLGARHAQGDLLWFVDADCTVPPDAILKIQQEFQRRPELAALIGSYDDQPAAPNLLSQYKNLLHHYVHQTAGRDGFTFWGACGVIRRLVFEELNGFDERYQQASIEDIELGYRAVARQKRIGICPELCIKHHKRWGLLGLLRTDFFLRAVPWSKLILRSGHMDNSMNISRVARWRVALTGVIVASLIVAIWLPLALAITAVATLLLLILDWSLFQWFRCARGWRFALSIIPWHWFSHLYSGVAFAYVNALAYLQPVLGQSDWELVADLDEHSLAMTLASDELRETTYENVG